MNSNKKDKLPFPYEIPLSGMEIDLIEDLLKSGCHLYPQRGKLHYLVRMMEQKVLPRDVVGKRAVRVPQPTCSIGLDMSILPMGIGVVDVENSVAAKAFLAHIGERDGFIIEKTPSGGLHILGWGLKAGRKDALYSTSIYVEYFTLEGGSR